jgi:AraC family transcriptional regulator of adaptative response/methylated-DNA-[protein]-cysteine methyltransferase
MTNPTQDQTASGSQAESRLGSKVKVPSLFPGKAWQQVLARDARADGQFVYAVKTTKIFCKPSCASRRPDRKNVSFFPNPEQARAAGYRACLRCTPEAVAPRADPQLAAIETVTAYLAEHSAERTTLKDVASATGVAPLTILRGFKRVLGVSPREYARAQRVERLRQKIREPKTSVTQAIYDAGFGSSSRAYEADPLGMTPSAMKAGGRGERIRYALGLTPLGRVLVAVTDRGVCAVAFGDSDEALAEELRGRFPHAGLTRVDKELGQEIEAVIASIEEDGRAAGLPLDVRMTAFQQRVWRALRVIPRGQTRSYGELARELGMPGGAQAVGQAIGSNPVALLVPCHRVVGSNGSLTGWRWGVERKRELLAMEGVDVPAVGRKR